jgi:thermitase
MRLSAHPRNEGRRQSSMIAAAILCAFLILSLAPGARGDTRQRIDHDPTGAPYVTGELLVAYEPGVSEAAEDAVVRESGGRTLEDLPGDVRLLSFPGVKREESGEAREQTLQRELRSIREEPRVEAADYNYIREASSDDPRFDDQWGLTKARFPGAWNTAQGTGANIALVDSGIDSNHPDIVDATPPDTRSKIVAQHDFVEGDEIANDAFGHGTHVAGIAGALTNNQEGVAGGCPECGLLVAKVMDAQGGVEDADAVSGIEWSVANGADVVNLSFGGRADSEILEYAIKQASSGGVVIVAAAGNAGTNRRIYPAAYRATIAVSATTKRNKLAGFSSYGNWVDLAAPGVGILSTVPTNGCNFCLRPAGTNYESWSGTSMSAPFVSALAGLLASQGMSASSIRQRMQATATDLGPAGKDSYYGYGRINADSAVR